HGGTLAFFVYLNLCIGVGMMMALLIESPGLLLRERFFPSRTMSICSEPQDGSINSTPTERSRKMAGFYMNFTRAGPLTECKSSSGIGPTYLFHANLWRHRPEDGCSLPYTLPAVYAVGL